MSGVAVIGSGWLGIMDVFGLAWNGGGAAPGVLEYCEKQPGIFTDAPFLSI